jgi:hypothetical protein
MHQSVRVQVFERGRQRQPDAEALFDRQAAVPMEVELERVGDV